MIDHLSASQITVYLDCSLKYRYNYIDRLPKPFRASGLALGSAIHAAVEWFHNIWAAGQEVDLESVCDIFEADWYAQTLEPIRYKKGENSEGILDLGRDLLKAYYEHAPRENVLQTEFAFELPLTDPENDDLLEVPLVGFIDKIEAGDVVVDLKTWSRMISRNDLDGNLQLSAYAYAYRMLHGKIPRLRLDVLLKTKTPRFEQLETSRTEADCRIFFQLCKSVYAGICKGVFLPNPGWKCTDCEYRPVCWFWNKNGNISSP